MNRTPEQWSHVSVDAVCAGSPAQIRNVLAMALADIAEMARVVAAAREWADDIKHAGFLAQTAMAGRPKAIALYRAATGDLPAASVPACEHGTVGLTRDGTPITARMVLCDCCGNKRCPHGTDHRNLCTGSNAPGQPGSRYT